MQYNIKVKVDDEDKRNMKVYLTVAANRAGEHVTDSRSLHPWLIREGFVANSDDCACVGNEKTEKATTFIFKARWIPEKWGGTPKPKLPNVRPVDTKQDNRLGKKKSKRKDDAPLNSKKMEENIDKRFDSLTESNSGPKEGETDPNSCSECD
jgi:hypothetical protein